MYTNTYQGNHLLYLNENRHKLEELEQFPKITNLV